MVHLREGELLMGFDLAVLEEKMMFTEETLFYLRGKMNNDTLMCFKLVAEATGPYGLLRTKIEDFKENRRAYDLGFTILESQGFIEPKAIGNMRPYFLTVRGNQLNELLNIEKKL
jgi:hypothetical protein